MSIEKWRSLSDRMWRECAGGNLGVMRRRFEAMTLAFPNGLDRWTDDATAVLGRIVGCTQENQYAALAAECLRRSHAVAFGETAKADFSPVPEPGERFACEFAFLHGSGPVKGSGTTFVERVPESETRRLATLPFIDGEGSVEFLDVEGVTFRSMLAPVLDGDVSFRPLDETGFVRACLGGVGWADNPYVDPMRARGAGEFAVAIDHVATPSVRGDRRTRQFRDEALATVTAHAGRVVSVGGRMFREVGTPRVGVVIVSGGGRFVWSSKGVSALSRPRPFVRTFPGFHTTLDFTQDESPRGYRQGVGLPITAHDVAMTFADRVAAGKFVGGMEADKAAIREWPLAPVDAVGLALDLTKNAGWLLDGTESTRFEESVRNALALAPDEAAAALRSITVKPMTSPDILLTRARLPQAILSACADLVDRPDWDRSADMVEEGYLCAP